MPEFQAGCSRALLMPVERPWLLHSLMVVVDLEYRVMFEGSTSIDVSDQKCRRRNLPEVALLQIQLAWLPLLSILLLSRQRIRSGMILIFITHLLIILLNTSPTPMHGSDCTVAFV